jgi:hypothetical protein
MATYHGIERKKEKVKWNADQGPEWRIELLGSGRRDGEFRRQINMNDWEDPENRLGWASPEVQRTKCLRTSRPGQGNRLWGGQFSVMALLMRGEARRRLLLVRVPGDGLPLQFRPQDVM